jgi:hypothetical protein
MGRTNNEWVFRPKPICEEEPRSQKRDLGHPLKVWKSQSLKTGWFETRYDACNVPIGDKKSQARRRRLLL